MFLACLRVLPSSTLPITLLPPSACDRIQQALLSPVVSLEGSVRKNTHYFSQGADSPVKGFLELVRVLLFENMSDVDLFS